MSPPPETVASNPARLRVDWPRHVRSFPGAWNPVWTPLVYGLLASLLFRSPFPFVIGLLLAGGAAWMLGRIISSHFAHGDVCASVVVATHPPLVAVTTDLNTGAGPLAPVIKILKHPLKRLPGGAPSVGTLLATVATYRGDLRQPRWLDFNPIAVRCVTDDEAEIARITKSIPPAEWNRLTAGLETLRKPYLPGLYHLSGPAEPDERSPVLARSLH